ncbi:MAG: glycosyltransferase family 2 protein [Candidatus Woesearchaeota archaeon]
MKLSIIVPVYNEEKTICAIIDKIKSVELNGITKEIIAVDDKSTDSSLSLLKNMNGIILANHEDNQGKGAAIRTGLRYVTGDIVLIQDADLEYDPHEYLKLLEPFSNPGISVVFGSRFLKKDDMVRLRNLISSRKNTLKSYSFLLGNLFLASMTSLIFHNKITDMETGYKVFRSGVIKGIPLKENRFGFEPEITAKLINRGYRILEIPITYHPRQLDEGKKITISDGIKALWYLIKYKVSG